MKKVLLFSILLTTSLSVSAQDCVTGHLSTLTNSKIQVKWDNYISNDCVDKIDNTHLTWLVDILNEKTSRCGIIFSTDSTMAKYVMLISPRGQKKHTFSTTQETFYTIKHIATGYLMAEIQCDMSLKQLKAITDDTTKIRCTLFSDNAINLGQYILKNASSKTDWYVAARLMSGVHTFNYRFDFSSMTIEGIDAKEYVAVNVYRNMDNIEKSFMMFCKKIELGFISGVNKNNDYKLDNQNEERFEIVLKITDVTEKGGHKIAVSVIDKITNQDVKQFTIKQGDGKLNTFQVLLMEQLAESVDDFRDKL